ncbi:PAAR domain-containing protein [Terrabacter sp. RAF57]|uniref:PAAR domain-containing protein n=1 Tax=Terrabacter sp. RAF57 TaxID=3233063 RepID=UPI003F978FC9
MGAAAARLTDTVTGSDTHIVMVPAPSGSVPTSLPGHPFSGTLTSAASSDVTIDGLAAAVVGTKATNSPSHVPLPPGTSFASPPSNSGEVSAGSSSVTIGGKAAARQGDTVRTCNDPTDADTSTITSGSTKVTIG